MRFRTPAPPHGLVRRRALGSEALYRVLESTPELVEVEVLSAPGLERGAHVRFTADAVRSMEPVSIASAAAAARRRELAGIH